jgi:hypothetical protein
MGFEDQMARSEPRSASRWPRIGLNVIGGAVVLFGSFFATLYVMDNFFSKSAGPAAQFVFDPATGNQPTLKPPFNIPNAAIDQSFAVRMRLVPTEPQVDYAAPVSSHTGDNRGFAILHKPGAREGYMAVIGNGKAFWFSEPFTIPSGKESELFVTYNNGRLRVSLNQAVVVQKTGLGPIAPAAAPVTIGDWHLGGRKFNGEIRAVEFFSEALPGT